MGLVLSIAGLALFFRAPGSPLTTSGFPDGFAGGETFLGFEANAWTAWITTAAGILVLIGAAQHAAARAMSLIVGLGLGAAAVIALFDGDDVLGLAAANGWTALGWGIASAILLITALLPRAKRTRTVDATDHDRDRLADRDRARIAEREHARAAARDRSHDVDQDGDRDHDRNRETAHPMTERADRPVAQPAATTSNERADGVPPVRSAPLRHTYEPRTHESETTAGARSADSEHAEPRPRR